MNSSKLAPAATVLTPSGEAGCETPPNPSVRDCRRAAGKHIIRELTGIGEFDQAARVDGWTEAVINLLGDAHRWAGAWRRDGHDRLPDFNRPAEVNKPPPATRRYGYRPVRMNS
jgi:hypothetical protein